MSNEKTMELLNLIKENPDLPIIPMVDSEVVGDGVGCWMGNWGWSCVEEYVLGFRGEVLLKDDDMYYLLEKYLIPSRIMLPESDEECEKIYNKIPWQKAIVVYINL